MSIRTELRKLNAAQTAAVAPAIRVLIAKYARILGVHGEVVMWLRDDMHGWLGQSTCLSAARTRIELQRRLLVDSRAFEKVIAHEVVHHWQTFGLTPRERARIPDHGEKFLEGAAKVNAVMGRGFVTELVRVKWR